MPLRANATCSTAALTIVMDSALSIRIKLNNRLAPFAVGTGATSMRTPSTTLAMLCIKPPSHLSTRNPDNINAGRGCSTAMGSWRLRKGEFFLASTCTCSHV
ncbi:hypothetical protein LZ31DRAFT_252143 [Colletotrichum somersetense]|nr:hypothetical protein LZ31DRAFT_252143 [Colletotrichum somersetense]